MEQKTILIICGVVILIIIGGAVIGLFVQAPKASVSGASISSANLTTLGLEINILVDSPYPVTIPIKNLQYTVAYQSSGSSTLLAEGEERGFHMKPGSQEIVLPVYVSNPALIGSVLDVLKTGEIRLLISGVITPDFYGITPEVPFSKEITTPVNTGTILSGIKDFAGAFLNTATA
jgi:LEA14-like dessication related protein